MVFKMAMCVIVVMIAPILYQFQFINAINHAQVIHHNFVEVPGALMSFEKILEAQSRQHLKQLR